MLADLKQKLDRKNEISIHLFFEKERNEKCKTIKYDFQHVSWNQKASFQICRFLGPFLDYPSNA
jgi:copper(I)-binding protein